MTTSSRTRISVITVCLNAAATIRRTIESVLGQTQPAHEYIIIDGGSTDGTLEIIAGFGPAITRVLSEKDRGISDAFNKGIRLATGDFIGLLNADDWYEPRTLELVAGYAATADVVHGDMQYWKDAQKDYRAEGNHQNLSVEMTVHHPTLFVRRHTYADFGDYKLGYRYAMDYELALRFSLAGARFVHVPEILANMSLKGLSDRHWRRALGECRRAKLELGLPKPAAQTRYVQQVVRSFSARLLKKIGLGAIVRVYRRNFAVVRKF